jgi:hypothetical protein
MEPPHLHDIRVRMYTRSVQQSSVCARAACSRGRLTGAVESLGIPQPVY